MVMDFELLLGGHAQMSHVKCEQVQNASSQNRSKPILESIKSGADLVSDLLVPFSRNSIPHNYNTPF